MKIGCLGETQTILTKFGAAPMTIQPTEIYTILERGTADAYVNTPAAWAAYNLQEVAKYTYTISLGGQGFFIIMNKDFWNKLPADIRDLFSSLKDAQAKAIYDIYEVGVPGSKSNQQSLELMKSAGVQVFAASAEDQSAVDKAGEETAWTTFVKDMTDKGLPGQKVLDRWVELNKKYQASIKK